MALTIEEKSDCRRHLMYPVAGLIKLSPAGGSLMSGAAGYRFTQAYGFLEYKMNNLNPDEEARVTGSVFGAVAFLGPPPNPGDSVSVVLSGGGIASPQTLTATLPSASVNVGDGRLWFANQIAALCSQNTVLQAAGVVAVSPYGTGPFTESVIPIPEVAFEASFVFTLTGSGTGAIAPQITSVPQMLSPSTSLDGVTTIWGYLPILNGLENYHAQASQNLDTKQAGPWYSRGNEIGLRTSLYRQWQQKLSDFLGTPLNPQRMNHARNVGALRYV
jgi:hypothetical protein